MKQETSIEEIAQKIVALSRCGPMQPDGVAAFVTNVLEARIVEALRNEREACAKVAENFKGGYTVDLTTGVLIVDEDGPWSLPINVAAAIRKGK